MKKFKRGDVVKIANMNPPLFGIILKKRYNQYYIIGKSFGRWFVDNDIFYFTNLGRKQDSFYHEKSKYLDREDKIKSLLKL